MMNEEYFNLTHCSNPVRHWKLSGERQILTPSWYSGSDVWMMVGPVMLSSVVGVCPRRPLLDTGVLAGVFKREFKLELMAVTVTGDRADPKYCYYDATQRIKDRTLSDSEQAVLSN